MRALFEADRSQVQKAYLSEHFYENMEDRSCLEGISWDVVENSVFDKISSTMTPQGVLCILEQLCHFGAFSRALNIGNHTGFGLALDQDRA